MPSNTSSGFLIFLLLKGNFAFECGVGQYQKDAECKECKTTCAKCISAFLCTECKVGFFGEACTNNCSESCKTKLCLKETGDCVSCKKGYYPDETCKRCPKNCTECHNANRCTNCKTGYTGSSCQKLCVNCKPDSGCSLEEGICTVDCKDGYSGHTCLKACESYCLSCNRVDARKCISCVDGKYGNNCDKSCPAKCKVNSCSKDTGTCTHGCQDGFWGDQCQKDCPTNCWGSACLNDTGVCSNGCFGNFKGAKCLCPKTCDCDEEGACIKCDNNTGYLCDKQCRSMCLNNICSINVDRKCLYGCKEGYKGSWCIQGITEPEVKTLVWKIVVPIFVIAVVISLSVLIMLIKKRDLVCRRQNQGQNTLENGAAERFLPPVNNTEPESSPEDQGANTYAVISACVSSTEISTSNLKDMTPVKITDEFEKLSASSDIKEEEETYDLPNTNTVSKSYQEAFNACYIGGYRKTEKYLACPYPGFKQKELFWKMVWDEMCYRIVMLSDSNTDKESEHYWPERGQTLKFGDLRVKCLNTKGTGGKFIQREFQVKRKIQNLNNEESPARLASDCQSRGRRFYLQPRKKTEKRTVLQLHFMDWPENHTPRSPSSLIEFQKYRDQIISDKIVVHCSDGIGRTGTYIALDILIQEGKAQGSVDVFTCVKSLREQWSLTQELRTQGKAVVQTHEQYSFLYEVLQSWFKPEHEKTPTCTPIDC